MSLLAKFSTILLVSIAALSAGCGGEATTVPFKKAGPPPPTSCIERHNKDETALELGKHAYSTGHDSRAARVTALNKPQYFIKDECLVVYADAENDREYGTLGQFSTDSGWVLMTDFPVKSERERIALQRTGAERANAELDKDGRLTAF